ncbi:hypothetical protein M3Y99_00980400 [Aphelenchoides fujianensis]|nr:hypothetical protein M3Y99_00980400 [Aphelenchoides fujianensis]
MSGNWITVITTLAIPLVVHGCLGGGAGGGQCCPPRAAPTCGPAVPPCGQAAPLYAPPPLPPQQSYVPQYQPPVQQPVYQPQPQASYYAVGPPQPPPVAQGGPYVYSGHVDSPALPYAAAGPAAPPAPPLNPPPPSPFGPPLEYREGPGEHEKLQPPPQATRNQPSGGWRSTTSTSKPTTERTSYSTTTPSSSSSRQSTSTTESPEAEAAGSVDEKAAGGYNFALQDDVEFDQQQVESARKTLESNSAEVAREMRGISSICLYIRSMLPAVLFVFFHDNPLARNKRGLIGFAVDNKKKQSK